MKNKFIKIAKNSKGAAGIEFIIMIFTLVILVSSLCIFIGTVTMNSSPNNQEYALAIQTNDDHTLAYVTKNTIEKSSSTTSMIYTGKYFTPLFIPNEYSEQVYNITIKNGNGETSVQTEDINNVTIAECGKGEERLVTLKSTALLAPNKYKMFLTKDEISALQTSS